MSNNDRKTSTENGILRQMFQEAKMHGAELAIHEGYGGLYLSEFGGTEADFVEAARESDDVAVKIKTARGRVEWLAWLVWSNKPCELVSDYDVNLFDRFFPLTLAEIDKADDVSF